MNSCLIRNCAVSEMGPFVAFAMRQGWNVGLSDADFLSRVDPTGYIIALDGDEIVGTAAAVKYGSAFGFIGYHIVRPDARGNGLGRRLLAEAMAKLGRRTVGLNCIESQLHYYESFGFSAAHSILRFEGTSSAAPADFPDMVSPFMIPFEKLEAFERKIFPYERKQFLSSWLAQPQSLLMAKYSGGEYRGYGMFRPCVSGFRIAPLLSDNPGTAGELLTFLLAQMPERSLYHFDIPAENKDALRLAAQAGMRKSAEFLRMYSDPAPPVSLDNIFGFPAVEIG
jgi:GNAT superfamily N-acetyltransferase